MNDPVGGIAASVAAAAALATVVVSVRYGRKAAKATRETVELARAARQEDEAYRVAAERDRLRHRYETIGGLVEEIFWAAERRYSGFDGNEFMEPRNRLTAAIVELEESLPRCVDATLSSSTQGAMGKASAARVEIHAEIRNLH